MLDVAVAYNRYKFLGFEFLTWLWFTIENDQISLKKLQEELISLDVGNRVVLENRQSEAMETVTIKGDDAGLEEGRLALKKGAVVTEINLLFKFGSQKWQFTLKGESLGMANLKTPEAGPIESRDDLEGAMLEKSYLYDKAMSFVCLIFNDFIKHRLSNEWNHQVVPQIRKWIAV
jgi:hypothetical protein